MRLLFRAGRVIAPEAGTDRVEDVLVENGVIADRGPALLPDDLLGNPPADVEVIDARGLCLAPGLVDMRVQLREPGEEHKENIASATAAAAAGGVTSLACLPNTEPVIDEPSLVEFIARRAAETGRARVYAYGAITRGRAGKHLTEMGLMTAAGAVGFTDSPHTVADARVLRRALGYASTFDQLILNHPEEPTLAAGGAMTEGEIATRLGLPAIPAAAEAIQIERDLRLVELTGGRYHAGPLTTAASIEAVRAAKRRGVAVTADTAPHYFALNETAIGDYRTFTKVSPPLRSEWDRRAVVDALKDGTIDVIASDHSPQDQDSKRLPFQQAEFGMIGLETLLPLGLELVHNGFLTLGALIAALSANPARILRRPGGTLAKGAPADLVLFDAAKPWRIDEKAFRSKSKNSPFDGRPVQGRVIGTWLGGRRVYGAAS
ncbi:MAG: dihydroorotase [Proteobacteria bacterium]|nr:dihydroorotase [Pseudomonadota bacterium]